ncbi:tRNA (adenosine(37)-N6)-threonylcarbamoyltransferase complex ATPase subunit type 1 TsaE [Marinirhabdus gelatinilytica]|uniref:tRNA threonylcarbamoyladenosine biosynthesis protein TsaE n=1 Tax=Marinirhabdus gelatinilytica TaxID=1703343 RepID=A0A370Q575_9FLAO|nr:tRNA (adenosine(37)-N6)-threonylcarbamoyltransferase complex ATPase subunit type 1 TsaE [Marinirhabdus gelatinilytica]RDK83494.1 tRNA threonylcarbamoyladenosine biosynthesis protein TsaE [Marinirhabdus gelatinilytica]
MKITYTLQELPDVAGKVLEEAQTKILLFFGAMGVGKTTFITNLAKQLGVREALSSPTFSIVNEYPLEDDKLYHFDCYRLEDEEQAMDIGIEEYLDSGHWCFVEWPEKIESLVPEAVTKIILTKNPNGSRTIQLMPMI